MDWADDTAYSLNDIADGINARFITLEALERWAEAEHLKGAAAEHVASLLKGIRNQEIEKSLRFKIGQFIAAVRLESNSCFLSGDSHRYRFRLAIDEAARSEVALYKRIALDLVFRSRQLQQLEHKSDWLLSRLFDTLARRYLTGTAPGKYRLLPESDEARLAAATDDDERARLVCDVITRMTDGAATRMCRRLFDADFQSLSDLG
jgi:dGTPase